MTREMGMGRPVAHLTHTYAGDCPACGEHTIRVHTIDDYGGEYLEDGRDDGGIEITCGCTLTDEQREQAEEAAMDDVTGDGEPDVDPDYDEEVLDAIRD